MATKTASLAKTFALQLKSTRQQRRLSQEALAQKAGISVSYVSMLEREQRTPPVETLARALQVPALDLLKAA